MKPEDFRQLILKPGTLLSLAGEYGGPSVWGDAQVQGNLAFYAVVEREFTLWSDERSGIWDTAIVMSLPTPLTSPDFKEREYIGSSLLLLHRYPDIAWNYDDPPVVIYGILENIFTISEPLELSSWRPKTMWLAGCTTMAVEDQLMPSPVGALRRWKRNRFSRDGE
jgi:hypothetical protein